MPIPTSAAWLASTSTTFGVRGDRLKALDKAIRDYELMATQENLVRIQEKLTIYNTAKGANWKDNERNSKNAITNLVKELQVQLYGVEPFSLTLEELAAVEDWKAARKEAARRLFAGTQLVNKVDSLTQQKQLRGAKTSEAVSTGVNLRTIGMSIDQLVTLAMRKAVSPGVFDEVLAYCHASGLYADVTAEMAKIAPALSIISNGATLVSSGVMIAVQEYEKTVREEASHAIEAGDPKAALDALGVVIEREQQKNIDAATMAAAQLASNAILSALDLGTGAVASVANAAFAIAKLALRLHGISKDFEEKKKANAKLADPANIDLKIFEVSPLLGCYLLVCSETSSLIVFLSAFGGIGWMDEVEDVVRNHLAPVQRIAASYLSSSRFVLKNENGTGLEQRMYVDAGLLAKAKKLKDGGWSFTNVGRWATMSPDDYKERYGVALPADFKERIEGRDRLSDERDALERRKRDVWDRFNNVKPKLTRR